jgi:hypothetical protein
LEVLHKTAYYAAMAKPLCRTYAELCRTMQTYLEKTKKNKKQKKNKKTEKKQKPA